MPERHAPDRATWLDRIERLGDRLPDPAVLFGVCLLAVMVLSSIGARAGWAVTPVRPEKSAAGSITLVASGDAITCRDLLTADGIYWLLESMVRNFIQFPPLGVVIVSMLGVGVAERSGLIGAALRAALRITPAQLLTPVMLLVGINASMTADAGFVILPPLAAALYRSAGRSPLAGAAVAFAGVAGGFSANLFITSLDPLLSGLTQTGARVLDPAAAVNPACNWWFMIASTVMLTLVGWPAASLVVERRTARRAPDEGGPPARTAERGPGELAVPSERRALRCALIVFLLTIGIIAACAAVPGMPLWTPRGPDGAATEPTRWVAAIVPIIFVGFLIPGVAYGWSIGSIRSGTDVTRLMSSAIASLAPMLVLSFAAAQFIAAFRVTNLDRMIAFGIGKQLAGSGLSPTVLLLAFVLFAMLFNLVIASASAKWSLLAPIFVPIFMLLGLSPATTQAAYRVADSVTNPITPLNPYMIVALGVIQQHAPRARMGTMLGLMLPFSLAFGAAWITLLLVWYEAGWALGPGGAAAYSPGAPH